MKRDSVTGRREAGSPRPRTADARLNLALLIQLSLQVEQAPEQLLAAHHATSKQSLLQHARNTHDWSWQTRCSHIFISRLYIE